MAKLAAIFEACAARGERALMPYLTGGDPDLAATRALLPAVAAAGGDIIEIGVPFSDPLLDGPVIQNSANRALLAGTTPPLLLETVAAVRPQISAGLVFMVPFNVVWRHGLQAFARDTAAAGVEGVLITDLPPEEADPGRPRRTRPEWRRSTSWRRPVHRRGSGRLRCERPASCTASRGAG